MPILFTNGIKKNDVPLRKNILRTMGCNRPEADEYTGSHGPERTHTHTHTHTGGGRERERERERESERERETLSDACFVKLVVSNEIVCDHHLEDL
jgi:hypothetical protein